MTWKPLIYRVFHNRSGRFLWYAEEPPTKWGFGPNQEAQGLWRLARLYCAIQNDKEKPCK